MVFISIGISGCGKTTYGEYLKTRIKDLKIICPDDIRAELSDISDQTNNGKAFSIVNSKLEEAMKNNENIYYSATNLTKKNRSNILKLCKKYNQDVIVIIFYTSYRPDICEKRVRKDLENGVNRSNTVIKDENGDTIVRYQYRKFGECMIHFSELEKEIKEHSKSYRFKHIECDKE